MLLAGYQNGFESLLQNPMGIITWLVAFLISFTLHEFAHVVAATALGDSTSKEQGRLTLNPLAHFDRIGTLLMVVVGIGFGKPVPVDPLRFQGVSPKVGMAIVGIAGPVINLILALLIAIPLQFKLFPFLPMRLGQLPGLGPFLFSWGQFAATFYTINIILATFNMIPFGPLDGSRVLSAFMPDWWFYRMAQIELPLLGLFLAFLAADVLLQLGILNGLIEPVLCASWELFVKTSPSALGGFCGPNMPLS